MKYTIITGNPIDGFECYGVFDNELDAVAHANQDGDLDDSWHVMAIHPIDPEDKPGARFHWYQDCQDTSCPLCTTDKAKVGTLVK